MVIFTKIKNLFLDAIKEHLLSCGLFLCAMISSVVGTQGWRYENTTLKYFTGLFTALFMGASLGILLCEAIHLYRKKNENYTLKRITNILLYAFITLVSSFVCFYDYIQVEEHKYFQFLLRDESNFTRIITFVLIAVMVCEACFIIYFFYKRNIDEFETYLAKAFCGVMKALLIYGIVAIGFLLIVWAFDTLIVDTSSIYLSTRIQILLQAFVLFPCMVVGLSKTDGKISKFSQIVLAYVFTGIVAIAFIIIYAYIVKILITWSFPKNQVFTILTCLFCFGAPIWTMAQGCCHQGFKLPLRIFPFLFIPFIVLQIMCLAMRVSEYGYTSQRYLGLVLIIYELIYFGLYIARFASKKDLISNYIFVIAAGVFIILLMPRIGMDGFVTASQAKRIEACFKAGDEANDTMKHQAYEAYNELKYNAGFTGAHYIDSLDEAEKDMIISYKDINPYSLDEDIPDTRYFYIPARNDDPEINVSGYDKLYIIDNNYYPDDDNLKITISTDDTVFGTVDLSSTVEALVEKYQHSTDTYSITYDGMLKQSYNLSNGDILIITSLDIDGNYTDETVYYDSIYLEGFVLHKD